MAPRTDRNLNADARREESQDELDNLISEHQVLVAGRVKMSDEVLSASRCIYRDLSTWTVTMSTP